MTPLGLLTVAGLTPEWAEVELTDEAVQPIDFSWPADLVGLTATTAAACRAYAIAREYRERGVPVVMGGMHASALPDEALEHVDAVVVGEAEPVWGQLLEDFRRGQMKRLYRARGFSDLAHLPPPAWHLIDPANYLIPVSAATSRGCPHRCAFCSVSVFFGRQYRHRPLDEVVRELQSAPPGLLALVDDNLMANRQYADSLLTRLRELGRTWAAQVSTTVRKTPELLEKAAKTGCRAMFLGLESISRANLKAVGKGFNAVSRYRELVRRMQDLGISVIGSFMFGLDEDGPDVFERTAEFVTEAGIDVPQYSILTPLPGTALYSQLRRENRITERDWSLYDGSHATYLPRNLTPEQLEEGLCWIYEQTYSWKNIVRRLARPLRPLTAAMNAAYRRRVRAWLAKLREEGPRPQAPTSRTPTPAA